MCLRSGIQGELEDAHTIRADAVVHDLGRVQVEERCPANAIRTLEEEEHRDCRIDAGVECRVAVD